MNSIEERCRKYVELLAESNSVEDLLLAYTLISTDPMWDVWCIGDEVLQRRLDACLKDLNDYLGVFFIPYSVNKQYFYDRLKNHYPFSELKFSEKILQNLTFPKFTIVTPELYDRISWKGLINI